jgi:hypothetical protein
MTSLQKISINDIRFSRRAAGNTFRRLLMALYEASAGEEVIYLTSRHNLVSWYMNHAKDLARAYLSGSAITVSGSNNRITICNRGYIQFMAVTCEDDMYRLRGLIGNVIEDD